MDHSKLFYVLNGLLNGERDVAAETTAGVTLADGHYYLPEGEVDGVGPFSSLQDAWDRGQLVERIQTWAFPLDGSDPHLDLEQSADANHATIEEVFEGDQSLYYECELDGSYETLTLKISCGSYEAAADVFRHVLLASVKYQ